MMRSLIRKLLGPSDIELPDEKKGKPVRRIGGGMTKGGEKDDARWLEHNERASEQTIRNLQRMSENIRAATGKKK
jgi:hypothetical protein